MNAVSSSPHLVSGAGGSMWLRLRYCTTLLGAPLCLRHGSEPPHSAVQPRQSASQHMSAVSAVPDLSSSYSLTDLAHVDEADSSVSATRAIGFAGPLGGDGMEQEFGKLEPPIIFSFFGNYTRYRL